MSAPHRFPYRAALGVFLVPALFACGGGTPAGDTTAPSTRATPVGGDHAAPLTVTLACSDGDGSGCATTYFTTDGTEPTAASGVYANPLSLTKSTTLKFFSVDQAGNVEGTRTEAYVLSGVDLTPPTTTASPNGGQFAGSVQVTLSCDDGSGGGGCGATHYTTDGSNPTEASAQYSAPITISSNTTLKFFSVDVAGNKEPVRSATYSLDTQAPTVVANPDGGSYRAVQVSLLCNDGTSGSGCANIFYTLDGGAPTTGSNTYASPIALAVNTTLRFFATDNAGNQSAISTETYLIDALAPVTTPSPNPGTFGGGVQVTLTCSDGSGSGCSETRFTTDGSSPGAGSTLYTAPITINATTTLKFFSTDARGNAEVAKSATFVIDAAPPTTTATPDAGIYASARSVTLRCQDGANESGCAATFFTTDGGVPDQNSTRFVSAISIPVTTNLSFFSVDDAGNAETPKTVRYIIDATRPVTTPSPPPGPYSSTVTVSLNCVDEDGGSGCAVTNYTTDGGNPGTQPIVYTGPFQVETTTTIRFQSRDLAGNLENIQNARYLIDAIAPTTRITPDGGVFDAGVQVTLSCTDTGGAGCTQTFFTLDGTPVTTASPVYTGTFSLTNNATVQFFSVDDGGATEAPRTVTFLIDTVGPTTAASPGSTTGGGSLSVTLTCDDLDGGSGCLSTHFTLDGGAPTRSSPVYTAPIDVSRDLTLTFFSVDRVGNSGPVASATYTGIGDTNPPVTTATPPGANYFGPVVVNLTCDDGTGRGCQETRVTLDGGDPTATDLYAGPIAISTDTTLKFHSVDDGGLVEAVQTAVYTFAADTTGPIVLATPAGGSFDAGIAVALNCFDDGGSGCAQVRFTLDGGDPLAGGATVYTGPIPLTSDAVVSFFGTDVANNDGPVVIETYRVDPSAPVTTASPTPGIFDGGQSVTLTCNDGAGVGCDKTYFTTNGQAPSTSSTVYSGPIAITATTNLRFFSTDLVGHREANKAALYTIDTFAPVTVASPPGGAYPGSVSVSLICTDDGGIGCAQTFFTTDGGAPELYSGAAFNFDVPTTLEYFSIDQFGNQETRKQAIYTISAFDAGATSDQIRAVRDAGQPGWAALPLPINNVLVTFIKPPVGTEDAGFFIQAEQQGPALFVDVAPSALTPEPVVGDRVSFVVNAKTASSRSVRATTISGFTRHSQGESVSGLIQQASLIDFGWDAGSPTDAGLSQLLDSELVDISGTIVRPFGAGGGGIYLSADFGTIGYADGGLGVRFRVPVVLRDELDLNVGCSIAVPANPLSDFSGAAQVQAWRASELAVADCPAPVLVSAIALTPNSLSVRFDHFLDAGSLDPLGSQFIFTNGLSATAVSYDGGNSVDVSTNTQVGGTVYNLSIASTLTDTRGKSVTNNLNFNAFSAAAELRITEANVNIGSGRDLVELYVVNGGTVNNFTLTEGGSSNHPTMNATFTFPDVTVQTGQVIVVHLRPDQATNGDAPANETTAIDQYPNAAYAANYNGAWDFHWAHANATGIAVGSRVLQVKAANGDIQDTVVFTASGTPPGAFPSHLAAAQAANQWLPADCGGVACTNNNATTPSSPTAQDISAPWGGTGTTRAGNSSRRTNTAVPDSNRNSDWAVGAHNFGLPNP